MFFFFIVGIVAIKVGRDGFRGRLFWCLGGGDISANRWLLWNIVGCGKEVLSVAGLFGARRRWESRT